MTFLGNFFKERNGKKQRKKRKTKYFVKPIILIMRHKYKLDDKRSKEYEGCKQNHLCRRQNDLQVQ